jgi:CheY-like chemotaxis protein
MAQVVALVDDLFFQAKLVETAKQLGVDLRTCATSDALATEIATDTPRLIIVDLNARGNPLDAAGRVAERVRDGGPEIPVVAFLSHVQVDLAARATEAGFREVMPRSKFTQNLATILARAQSQS